MLNIVQHGHNRNQEKINDYPLPRVISVPKHKNLLDAAQELFFRFGLHKVTVDEICAKAKVSKMTFYKEFENKNQLALMIYEFYNESAVKDTQELLELPIDFLEMIERLILLKQKYSRLLGNIFMKEIVGEDEIFSQLIDKFFKEQKQLRLKILQRGKSEGYIRPEVDGDLFDLLLQNFASLLHQHEFLEKYPDIEKLSRLSVELFFYGLSNCREKISNVPQKKTRQQTSKGKSKSIIPKKSHNPQGEINEK